MIEPVFQDTILQIYDRLAETSVLWVVTGSLGMALQGMPVTVHDIDLQTDAAGAYKIAHIFAGHITRPVTLTSTEIIRSHFGAFQLNGIQVEIMGDLEKRLGNGRWEPPPNLHKHRRFVDRKNRRIPVLDLAFEWDAYKKMGRLDKADFLRKWLLHP